MQLMQSFSAHIQILDGANTDFPVVHTLLSQFYFV